MTGQTLNDTRFYFASQQINLAVDPESSLSLKWMNRAHQLSASSLLDVVKIEMLSHCTHPVQ